MEQALREERVFGGRYRATHVLKSWEGAETLLAVDLAQGAEVVVKVVSASRLPGHAQRLEHEAQALREMRSPWLTPLLQLGEEGDLVYLVTPFVPGHTLEALLRRGPLSASDTVLVGRCILSALSEAHDHGILHRDVKPANIIVGQESPLRAATLIDFGLACTANGGDHDAGEPAGTLRYMSPEQSGLLRCPVDSRSDLYSVGATLFECLRGAPAFPGDSVTEVLRQHLSLPLPEASGFGAGVPRALGEVVRRLLQKDPERRYQSARAALADLEEIARALDRGESDPQVSVGARDVRRVLAEPAFVGRSAELMTLCAELDRARRGMGRLTLLEAPSGGGKTRLLSELMARARREGALVMRGHGVDQEAKHPFQELQGVVRDLAQATRADPALSTTLGEELGEDREAVCAAIPQLTEVLGSPATASLGLEQHAAVRTRRGLTALLDALGSERRPALVLLDDCQWADEETLDLLAHWQRRARDEAGRYLCVVASFRSEEVLEAHRLRHIDGCAGVALGGLGARELQALVTSMAGDLPAEAIDAAVRFSGGSPFLAAAILHGMVEARALIADGGTWRVDAAALRDVQLSQRAAVFLSRRIERLPAAVLSVLSVGAVLGREFELDLLGDLAEVPADEVDTALEEARQRQIVWVDPSRRRAAFLHDKLREAVLERLPDPERRRLHRAAALRLERARENRVFELAHHFDGAGDAERALAYALSAAESARAHFALEVAERYFQIAESHAAAQDASTRLRVLEGLGDVRLLRGRYEEGARSYEAAIPLCPHPAAAAAIEGRLGQLEMKRGRNQVAIGALERALAHLGKPPPRTRARLFFGLLLEVLAQILHTWFPRFFVGRRRLESAQKDLVVAGLLKHISLAYFLHGDAFRSLWAHLTMLNLTERYPPTPELGQAYGEHGWIFAPWKRALRYAERGVAICEALGDHLGLARAFVSLGYAYCTAGRYREAMATLEQGDRLFERVGEPFEGNWDRVFLAFTFFRAGDLRRALELSRRGYASSVTLGEGFGAASYLLVLARIGASCIPSAWLDAERSRRRDHLFEIETLLQVDAEVALAEGQPADAVAALGEADRLVREAGVQFDTVVAIPIRLAAALREEAAKLPACDARRREELLRRACRAARRGLRFSRKFRNNLPMALREMGEVEAARGHGSRARRLLCESLTVAERQGQRYERARSLSARGRIGLALGWPGAAQDEAAAREALAELGAPDPVRAQPTAEPITLSIADRFATLLEAGRKIATSLTREAVFASTQEAGQALLRGERCLVLEVAQDAREGFLVRAGEGEYRRALVERALTTGHPVVFAEGVEEGPSESVVLAGLRSALCAPIRVRGVAVGCLYVEHQQVSGLFASEEERLAEFVTTLAGGALENADGVEGNRRAQEEIRRLGEALLRSQEEERKRLALSLHDGAGQSLTALGLRLDELGRRESDPVLRRTILDMRGSVSDLMEDVRRLAHDLRPAALDRLGLPEALRDLALGTSTPSLSVEVRVEPSDFPPLEAEIAVNLFRIAQAALTNIALHAHAKHAWIELTRSPASVRLEVRDDGAGFLAKSESGLGIGMVGMRERALSLGGSASISAGPGEGTRICIEIPLGGRA
jgi:signal transduction histidine kinase